MTRLTPTLLALAVLGALAACGSDDDGGTADTPAPTTAAAAATTAAAVTTAAPATTEEPATTAAADTTAGDDMDDPYNYGPPKSEPATTEDTAATDDTSAEATTATTAAAKASLAVANDPDLGDYIVDAGGFALYLFANDTGTTSTCTGGCASAWPPAVSLAEPVVGEGLDPALVGTTTRDDGVVQLTYGGHPLYRFSGDISPADTTGQDSGGVWFLVNPAGEQV